MQGLMTAMGGIGDAAKIVGRMTARPQASAGGPSPWAAKASGQQGGGAPGGGGGGQAPGAPPPTAPPGGTPMPGTRPVAGMPMGAPGGGAPGGGRHLLVLPLERARRTR
jgi:hypothetical protein